MLCAVANEGSVLALTRRREAVEDALELGVVGDHLQRGGADLTGLLEEVGVAHARGESDDRLDVPRVDGDHGAQVIDGLARAAELAQDEGEEVADLAVVRAQADGVHQVGERRGVAVAAADGEREQQVWLPVAGVAGDELAEELGGAQLGLVVVAADGVDGGVVAVLEFLDVEREDRTAGEGVVVEAAAREGEDLVEVGAGGDRVVADAANDPDAVPPGRT